MMYMTVTKKITEKKDKNTKKLAQKDQKMPKIKKKPS